MTAKFPSGVWGENVIDLWCLHGRKEGDTTPILDSVSNMLQYSRRRANKWHIRLWLHRHFPWAGFPLQTNSLCKNYITHIVSQMILKVFFFFFNGTLAGLGFFFPQCSLHKFIVSLGSESLQINTSSHMKMSLSRRWAIVEGGRKYQLTKAELQSMG